MEQAGSVSSARVAVGRGYNQEVLPIFLDSECTIARHWWSSSLASYSKVVERNLLGPTVRTKVDANHHSDVHSQRPLSPAIRLRPIPVWHKRLQTITVTQKHALVLAAKQNCQRLNQKGEDSGKNDWRERHSLLGRCDVERADQPCAPERHYNTWVPGKVPASTESRFDDVERVHQKTYLQPQRALCLYDQRVWKVPTGERHIQTEHVLWSVRRASTSGNTDKLVWNERWKVEEVQLDANLRHIWSYSQTWQLSLHTFVLLVPEPDAKAAAERVRYVHFCDFRIRIKFTIGGRTYERLKQRHSRRMIYFKV